MSQQPGYALTPIPVDPNWPNWVQFTVPVDQARADLEYLHGSGNSLDHYYAMAAQWKETESRARDASADPANYKARAFTNPVPIRQIAGFDVAKMEWTQTPAPPDPAIVAPMLDPYVAPPTPKPMTTSAPTAADDNARYNAQMTLLAAIAKDVAAIKTRLGM